MPDIVTETFFLPEETGCEHWTLPSDIYNLSYTLLKRSEHNCVFVPIRNMQFLAVITDAEIVFVDSLAYACNQNQGGRLIMLVWKFTQAEKRASLHDPVPCTIHFHHADSEDIQRRLVGDFRDALELLDQRYRNRALPADGARIIKLKPPG